MDLNTPKAAGSAPIKGSIITHLSGNIFTVTFPDHYQTCYLVNWLNRENYIYTFKYIENFPGFIIIFDNAEQATHFKLVFYGENNGSDRNS